MAPNVRWADRHPVLASVRTAITTTSVLAALAWLAKKLIPQPEQDAIWSWLTTKVEYPRGIWVLLFVALIAWALFAAWALVRRYLHRTPAHELYRTDEFFELRWRWQWFHQDAVGAKAFCPECDLELEPRLLGATITGTASQILYECPVGHKQIVFGAPTMQAVAAEIGRHIEREARKSKLLRD